MDYEDEQEEQAEPQVEPHAEDVDMDDEDLAYLNLHGECERQAYALIKNRRFGHTKTFDPELLAKIGMDVDFANVWSALGWDGFAPVEEFCSRILTIQFLRTLQEVDDGISFRIFEEEHYFSWKTRSTHLGFNKRLPISLEKACCGFNRHKFWALISGQVVTGKFTPRRNEIQYPTLRLILLSVETHRRAATGNTKSREVAGALAGTAPSSTARNSVAYPENVWKAGRAT